MGSVGPHDKDSFAYIMALCVSIGLVTSIIFHFCVASKRDQECIKEEPGEASVKGGQMSALDWMKEPQTYQVKNGSLFISKII